jgi:hypothetical protein
MSEVKIDPVKIDPVKIDWDRIDCVQTLLFLNIMPFNNISWFIIR